jgi:membrane protein YqaA with SNARE-associated domain
MWEAIVGLVALIVAVCGSVLGFIFKYMIDKRLNDLETDNKQLKYDLQKMEVKATEIQGNFSTLSQMLELKFETLDNKITLLVEIVSKGNTDKK